ncbi:MAG: cytochrome C oxidase subunit II [Myxococcales bacterium]|nr:cytochrome C oxidase subunit II [Myxococcales bacterium]
MNTKLKAWVSGAAALGALGYGSLAYADPIPETSIWGLPRDASVDGHRIDWLINVTNVFVGILFVIMCVWMVYSAVKHNEKHKAEYDHGDSKHHIAVAMGVSAVIFFVVDGNLWFNSTIDVNTTFWNHAAAEKHPEAVLIELNAHQWAWDARYAGEDGKFNTADDVVTLNDIRVPKGVPIVFQIASTDVIHSFYLPNFRVKQDAMPGMITRMWFTAKDAGEFEIGCAQHCGTHHYKMKGLLTVLEKEDYKRWSSELGAQRARAFDPKNNEANWGWEWKHVNEGNATGADVPVLALGSGS